MKKNEKQTNYTNLIRPGMSIIGKWHRKKYVIKKKLGAGAVGTVYLCECNGKKVALKISKQEASVMVEVNVLKALQKVQGTRLGPYLLDVDDWVTPSGMIFSFYVMEYLEGENISLFIKRNGKEWTGVFMLQLLHNLEELHQAGWIFGDLKTDNLLVVASPPRVRMVDVGGTTQIGRSIKEFTEFYDRGYWGMGTRRAEPSYDLFALVMVFLSVFYPNHFPKSSVPEQTLFKKIDEVHALYPYRKMLKKAIIGKYASSAEMAQDLTHFLYSRQKRRQMKQQTKYVTRIPIVIEAGGILTLAVGLYLSSLLFV